VDDEAAILQVVSRLLKLEGHEVTTIQQSDAAKHFIETEEFDLLISDMRMAPLSGLDLLKVAKERRPNMKSIIITAYHSPPIYREAKKLGAIAYMPKPFDPQYLVGLVEKCVSAKP